MRLELPLSSTYVFFLQALEEAVAVGDGGGLNFGETGQEQHLRSASACNPRFDCWRL